jgi:integrase
VFVFAFYARGMRFGDVCRLRPENVEDGTLDYLMMKTGQRVRGKLPPPAVEIAERYVSDREFLFPFLDDGDDKDPKHLRRRIASNNVLVNKALKDVADAAEIKRDGLSMHVARHSYADFARRKSGNLHAIMESLGHTSLQVTQQYLKSLDKDASDELDDQLWGEEDG